jgi:hypothetical protein
MTTDGWFVYEIDRYVVVSMTFLLLHEVNVGVLDVTFLLLVDAGLIVTCGVEKYRGQRT